MNDMQIFLNDQIHQYMVFLWLNLLIYVHVSIDKWLVPIHLERQLYKGNQLYSIESVSNNVSDHDFHLDWLIEKKKVLIISLPYRIDR